MVALKGDADYARVHAAYLTYKDLLDERRADPGEDLMSAMLTLTDEDGSLALTDDEVLAHMVGITAAGTDTTSNLVVNMVRYFTESPDQLALVRAQPELWDNVTDEGRTKLAAAADPSLDPEWPVSISVPDWTTYSKDEIIACKGPGE